MHNIPLALQPHHDGSALYVSLTQPELEGKVKIRIRVHKGIGEIKRIMIRQSDSGEAFFTAPLKLLHQRRGWSWFEGSITMFNPQVNYRFFIELVDGSSYWLNALGLHEIDQPDRDNFKINCYQRPPTWATGSVLYQVFPDRFAASSASKKRELPDWAISQNWNDEVIGEGPGVSEQFFGGDLKGIEEHLDHLKKLGVTILYLTPFFPAGSNHRYDSSNFDEVDPLLGGNKALISLVKAAHKLGIKVMGDLTANHSGDKHEWFLKALGNPKAQESDFYYFSNNNTNYDSWWGVPSLPKFNWKSEELRKRFIKGPESVVAKWLKPPFGLDGWRIDVANMTGWIREDFYNQEVANQIRQTMSETKSDAFLIGEFTSDAAQHVDGQNYQGSMTYSNFTRPVWRWLWNLKIQRDETQMGPGRKGISGSQLVQLHNQFAGTFPWQVRMHNLNALDTHDSGRFKTYGIEGSSLVAAGLQFTFPGIPLVFAGDEFGLEGYNGEHSRTPIPWDNQPVGADELISNYAKLAKLRKSHRALAEGSMRFLYASEEAVMFVRETKTESILVLASRSRDRRVEIPKDSLAQPEQAVNLFGGESLRVVGSKIRYEAKKLDLQIWRLPSAHR